jgi:hypothetical protein
MSLKNKSIFYLGKINLGVITILGILWLRPRDKNFIRDLIMGPHSVAAAIGAGDCARDRTPNPAARPIYPAAAIAPIPSPQAP